MGSRFLLQRHQRLFRSRVPQFDGLLAVLAARNYQTFVRMPIDALDVGAVACFSMRAKEANNTLDSGHQRAKLVAVPLRMDSC